MNILYIVDSKNLKKVESDEDGLRSIFTRHQSNKLYQLIVDGLCMGRAGATQHVSYGT